MRPIYRVIVALALMGVLAGVGTKPVWAQCSMCRTALTGSTEGQQMARGFNTAILFLLGAPYLVFGTLAAFLWVKRSRVADRHERESVTPVRTLPALNRWVRPPSSSSLS